MAKKSVNIEFVSKMSDSSYEVHYTSGTVRKYTSGKLPKTVQDFLAGAPNGEDWTICKALETISAEMALERMNQMMVAEQEQEQEKQEEQEEASDQEQEQHAGEQEQIVPLEVDEAPYLEDSVPLDSLPMALAYGGYALITGVLPMVGRAVKAGMVAGARAVVEGIHMVPDVLMALARALIIYLMMAWEGCDQIAHYIHWAWDMVGYHLVWTICPLIRAIVAESNKALMALLDALTGAWAWRADLIAEWR